MQIVIDIPEEEYKDFCERYIGSHNTVINAMCKGTPLPKGHGRLIDENDLSLMTVHLIDGVFVCDAPTIIEKDKEQEDEANN